MKVEIKTKDNGVCEYFKINDHEFGIGIYELNIKIGDGKPRIIIKAVSDDFIMSSEDAKLYLEKYESEEIESGVN